MKIKEIKQYLEYADPDLDIYILSTERYYRLLKKAKALDEILKYMENMKKNLFNS